MTTINFEPPTPDPTPLFPQFNRHEITLLIHSVTVAVDSGREFLTHWTSMLENNPRMVDRYQPLIDRRTQEQFDLNALLGRLQKIAAS